VDMRRELAGLDSFEGVGHWRAAQDCQTPVVARSRPVGSGLGRVWPCPCQVLLDIVVDIEEGYEGMSGWHKDLDSGPAEVVVVAGDLERKEVDNLDGDSFQPWCRNEARTARGLYYLSEMTLLM
jgi:hypothetical protein